MAIVQIIENTTNLAASLMQHAQAMRDATQTTGESRWFRPSNWQGNVFDINDLGTALSREELYTAFRNAVSSPDSSGTVGDLQAILVQGDNLAAAERAFRMRHASSVRTKLHASGRHRGHGDPNGVVNNGHGNYLKQLIQLASG